MDIINEITSYIAEPMLVVILALWVLGMFLKRTPYIPDWAIIWVLLVVGVILGFITLGITAEGFVQGVLVAGVAVLGHNLIKQTREGYTETKTKHKPEISD